MPDMVCLTRKQVYVIVTGVEKLKGWLDYSKTIVSCLEKDNLKLIKKVEQLEKQIMADQYAQIFKIQEKQKLLTL